MAKGGLQTSTSSVPLPFHSSTCNNAITVTSESTEITPSVTESLPLSKLVDKTHLISPVLDIDQPFSSSLDSNFELLEFENSKFSSTSLSFENITTLPLSQFSNMESDCKKGSNASSMPKASASSNDEILQVRMAISSQVVVGHQDLQNQLISSNQQLQTELQRVCEDNENFKREMWLELANAQGQLPTSAPVLSDVGISPASLSSPTSSIPSALHGNGTSSSTEFQAQMLAVLNYTCLKLSLVIQDTRMIISESKSLETKTD
jgi:hypothetical protein